MTRDDIIRMAREAGLKVGTNLSNITLVGAPSEYGLAHLTIDELKRFAALVEQHLIQQGYRKCAKGQRTTQFCGMLEDAVKAEREACARVCEEKKNYSMPIPCPDGISGCLVLHSVPAKREKTGEECAADIRARSKT
ncbi:MAG: hypothetical protein EBS87_11870 [Sphingomonadaceae bacterium]|nr:hypothetical protein [Sphingomonadaceae bacterium]